MEHAPPKPKWYYYCCWPFHWRWYGDIIRYANYVSRVRTFANMQNAWDDAQRLR